MWGDNTYYFIGVNIAMQKFRDIFANACANAEIKSLLEDILSDYKAMWDADDPNSSTAKMVVRIEQTLTNNQ